MMKNVVLTEDYTSAPAIYPPSRSILLDFSFSEARTKGIYYRHHHVPIHANCLCSPFIVISSTGVNSVVVGSKPLSAAATVSSTDALTPPHVCSSRLLPPYVSMIHWATPSP